METYGLTYDYTDIGYCRVQYYYVTPSGNKAHYCLMEDQSQVNMYRCSQDGEADYQIKLKENCILETPPDKYGKELYARFLGGI